MLKTSFAYPGDQQATTILTFVRHKPDGTNTPPNKVEIDKGKHLYWYLGYPNDCSEDLHYTITAEPSYADSSIPTEPVTIELKGKKTVGVSKVQGAINTVGGACVANFSWEWEHETPQRVSWKYEWFGPETSFGSGSITDPNVRNYSFTYTNAPCSDEGVRLTIYVSPVLSESDAQTTLTRRVSGDIQSPVVKKEVTSKSTNTSEATYTAEKPAKGKATQPNQATLAATGTNASAQLSVVAILLAISGVFLVVGSRRKLTRH